MVPSRKYNYLRKHHKANARTRDLGTKRHTTIYIALNLITN